MSESPRSLSRATTHAENPDAPSQIDQSEIGNTSTPTNRLPTSYVWKYFIKLSEKEFNKCRFVMGDGRECGKELARDKKGSTTSMKNHLETRHGICDANVPDQSNILAAFKKAKTGHVVSLSSSCSSSNNNL